MNNGQAVTHFATPPSTQTIQHDYILLDGSGSMMSKWWDMLDAIEAYVQGVKAQNIKSQIILHTFDTADIDCVQRNVEIGDWKPLSTDPIGANWGSTPLYDAINTMCRRLRDLNPPRCAITIVTDGDENASKYTDLVQATAMLDWCRAKGWQVTFIGCDFNNSSQARALGANEHTAIGVQKKLLSDAARNLAEKRARYGVSGTPMHFSDEEKQQFGGYLNGPAK